MKNNRLVTPSKPGRLYQGEREDEEQEGKERREEKEEKRRRKQ